MIRCEACRTLNEDNARSCSWCGTSLWLSGRTPTGEVKRAPAMQAERPPVYSPPPHSAYQPPVAQPVAQRPQSSGYRCPYCQSATVPFTIQKISDAGWIVFAIMMLACFPLFWIGLLMKQDESYCSVCRARLS
jgi:hypothetical protein